MIKGTKPKVTITNVRSCWVVYRQDNGLSSEMHECNLCNISLRVNLSFNIILKIHSIQ
jgi:hypothetical protein